LGRRTIAADSHVTDEILRPQREGFGCFALTTDKQISDIPRILRRRTIAADSHVTDEILRPQREGFGCFALTTDKQISDILQLNFAGAARSRPTRTLLMKYSGRGAKDLMLRTDDRQTDFRYSA
jgi:hypothetical protein